MAKLKKKAAATTRRKKAGPKRKRSAPKVQAKRATTKARIETKAPIEATAPIVVKLPIELRPQGSWEHGKEAAAAKEHTKTADERSTIRATASGNWTNRQRGRG